MTNTILFSPGGTLTRLVLEIGSDFLGLHGFTLITALHIAFSLFQPDTEINSLTHSSEAARRLCLHLIAILPLVILMVVGRRRRVRRRGLRSRLSKDGGLAAIE